MTKKKSVSHITEMRNELFTGVVDKMGLKGDLFVLIFYCIINTEEAIKNEKTRETGNTHVGYNRRRKTK